MSTPWLKRNRQLSRSRSPSYEKSRRRVDQFGRSLPLKSKSRSRSSSRSRDRSLGRQNSFRRSREPSPSRRIRGGQRNLNRGYNKTSRKGRTGNTREEQYSRKKSNNSSSSSSDSESSNNSPTRIVASSNPKHINSRIFVANIISKEVTKGDLIKQFEKYGPVIDVLVHTKNYAFIQFMKEDQAQLAVEGEHGSTFKGWRLDVKMAFENRKGSGGRGDEHRGGRGGGAHFGSSGRDRFQQPGDPLPGPFPDPYFDARARPPVPFPGAPDFRGRDPFFMDPYRRGFPEPWLGEDPYRRGLYGDPYRDLYSLRPQPPPPPPPVIECEIFITSAQLQAYGQAVEQRIKEHNIITTVSIMPETRTAAQLVEELTAQSGLFAIFVNPQNEMHRSLTVSILHGVPQEHRNMPLDDAVILVGASFLKYVDGLREKAQAAAAPLPSSSAPSGSRSFLPPSSEILYLLNLLADNRALTVAELDTVIEYLHERREKLINAESRPVLTEETQHKSPSLVQHGADPELAKQQLSSAKQNLSVVNQESSSVQEPASASGSNSKSISEDLASKILSLFGNARSNVPSVPPANGKQQQVSQSQLPAGAPTPAPPQAAVPSSASLINFDNPNVQKALDNLIQNTPNLFKNINANNALAAAAASMAAMQGGSDYGRDGEIVGHTQGKSSTNQNTNTSLSQASAASMTAMRGGSDYGRDEEMTTGRTQGKSSTNQNTNASLSAGAAASMAAMRGGADYGHDGETVGRTQGKSSTNQSTNASLSAENSMAAMRGGSDYGRDGEMIAGRTQGKSSTNRNTNTPLSAENSMAAMRGGNDYGFDGEMAAGRTQGKSSTNRNINTNTSLFAENSMAAMQGGSNYGFDGELWDTQGMLSTTQNTNTSLSAGTAAFMTVMQGGNNYGQDGELWDTQEMSSTNQNSGSFSGGYGPRMPGDSRAFSGGYRPRMPGAGQRSTGMPPQEPYNPYAQPMQGPMRRGYGPPRY